MITKRTNVKGLGLVAQSDGNLVDNVRDLKGRLISFRDEAYARVNTSGIENIGQTGGTRTAVEFDYIKGEVPVVSKYDKLSLAMAKRAVAVNYKGKYLCTNSTKRHDTNRKTADREEKSGVPYEERTAIVLPRESFNMSLSENKGHLVFFFKDMAILYFEHNKNNPITCCPLDKSVVDGNNPNLLENLNGTIVVPFGWFRSLDYGSELNGSIKGADNCGNRAHGVLS